MCAQLKHSIRLYAKAGYVRRNMLFSKCCFAKSNSCDLIVLDLHLISSW
jgi:hypothetical protein